MPRFFCDYCDAYLTHDSAPGRQQHIRGYKHRECFRNYYSQFYPQFQQEQMMLQQQQQIQVMSQGLPMHMPAFHGQPPPHGLPPPPGATGFPSFRPPPGGAPPGFQPPQMLPPPGSTPQGVPPQQGGAPLMSSENQA